MDTPKDSAVLRPVENVYGWVEDESSVMFKAVTQFGDPVELTANEARTIAATLHALADSLESKAGDHS
ncbi:MAG TPA: hypothetical protein VGZ25_01485 [Gemmataceae bacterium]|jgi:hypothetical protein|nr:hypothetical protein [Gemmataceae bacterium]